MSSSQTQTTQPPASNSGTDAGSIALRGSNEPLKPTGALDKYAQFEVTPVIGRQYGSVQLRELLQASNSDELIRELAIVGTPTSSKWWDHC